MALTLRNFLYLDERLTSQYLGQLEGGIYAEEAQSTTTGRTKGANAGAKAGPFEARGSRGQTNEATANRTVRQTPESEYQRLEGLLESEDALQWLEAFDDAVWLGLKRGEVLQIEAKVTVPQLYSAIEMASEAAPIMGLMENLGEDIDDETKSAMASLEQLKTVLKTATVIAKPAGATKYKFICPLKPEFLRDGIGGVAGDCIVVGTLGRRLKSGEKYSLLDAMGLGGLPREQRRQAERDMKKDMPDAIISGQAAIIEPLAIYR